MARPVFDEELHQLRLGMVHMSELVKEAIEGSFEAVWQGSETKAYLTANNDSLIDDMERKIESLCLRLLLREQPVASDLRIVTASLKIITDLERIGDQASEICRIAINLPEDASFAQFSALAALSAEVKDQVNRVITSYVHLDLYEVQSSIKNGAKVEVLFEEAKRDILHHIVNRLDDGTVALEALMVAKYLERIGGHAVNMAEWAEYAITGVHKGQAFYEETGSIVPDCEEDSDKEDAGEEGIDTEVDVDAEAAADKE